jgi:hypothetical protein
MSENAFDVFTRDIGDAVSRRASLMTLGGAALVAALAGAPAAEAKKNNNKKAKKAKKRARRRLQQTCDAQPGQCQTAVQAFCANQGMRSQSCLQQLSRCCTLIVDCNVTPAFTCVFNSFQVDNIALP